jgi:hypothetical protein
VEELRDSKSIGDVLTRQWLEFFVKRGPRVTPDR